MNNDTEPMAHELEVAHVDSVSEYDACAAIQDCDKIGTIDPYKQDWREVAAEVSRAHPSVTIAVWSVQRVEERDLHGSRPTAVYNEPVEVVATYRDGEEIDA